MQIDLEQETRDAWTWALSTGHVKVTPVLTTSAYKYKKERKTVSLFKVKLVIHIDNAKHVGEKLYKQDREMANKIDEIYLHYFRQSEDYKRYVKNEGYFNRT